MNDRGNAVIAAIDSWSERIGRLICWLAVAEVLVVVLIVLLRYLFHVGHIGLQESVTYINSALFAFGAAYTLKARGHVRVDFFYNRLASQWQALIDMVGTVLLLGGTCAFIIWASWDYVALSWQSLEGSAETSGLPFVFLLKTLIPLLAGLLLVQGIAEFLRAPQKFRSAGEQR